MSVVCRIVMISACGGTTGLFLGGFAAMIGRARRKVRTAAMRRVMVVRPPWTRRIVSHGHVTSQAQVPDSAGDPEEEDRPDQCRRPDRGGSEHRVERQRPEAREREADCRRGVEKRQLD